MKKEQSKNIIGHLDMDSFFASLEEIVNPQFKGRPIVVGSDPKEGKGRGVVSTANYLARSYGIHSALPISQAWKMSQQAKSEGKSEVVFLPSNFPLYERVSRNILHIIRKYSSEVEQGSIDEFYFNLSFLKDYEQAEDVCRKIKEDIKKAEKVTCSIGIGPNKLISKIAAGLHKPNGLLSIKEDDIPLYLNSLPIKKIPGIGPKTEKVLHSHHIYLISDLLKLSQDELFLLFKNAGLSIYNKARGIDDSELVLIIEHKSIGEQFTFEEDVIDSRIIIAKLISLYESVVNRLNGSDFNYFNRIVLTIRFSDFSNHSSSYSLKLNENKSIKTILIKLILPFLDRRKNPALRRIRQVGVRLENLEKMPCN